MPEGLPERDSDGSLPAYGWPGGYPIAYYDKDGCTLCAECATKELREYEQAKTEDPESLGLYAMTVPVSYDVIEESDPVNGEACEGCNRYIDTPEWEREYTEQEGTGFEFVYEGEQEYEGDIIGATWQHPQGDYVGYYIDYCGGHRRFDTRQQAEAWVRLMKATDGEYPGQLRAMRHIYSLGYRAVGVVGEMVNDKWHAFSFTTERETEVETSDAAEAWVLAEHARAQQQQREG